MTGEEYVNSDKSNDYAYMVECRDYIKSLFEGADISRKDSDLFFDIWGAVGSTMFTESNMKRWIVDNFDDFNKEYLDYALNWFEEITVVKDVSKINEILSLSNKVMYALLDMDDFKYATKVCNDHNIINNNLPYALSSMMALMYGDYTNPPDKRFIKLYLKNEDIDVKIVFVENLSAYDGFDRTDIIVETMSMLKDNELTKTKIIVQLLSFYNIKVFTEIIQQLIIRIGIPDTVFIISNMNRHIGFSDEETINIMGSPIKNLMTI